MAIDLTRQARDRHLLRRVGIWCLASILLGLTGSGFNRTLTFTQVGTVPGNGPCGITVVETGAETYAALADHNGNLARLYRIDLGTGTFSLVDDIPLPNGPTALAASPDGCFVLGTTLHDSKVTSFKIDSTGNLSLAGSVSSGGTGPVSLDLSADGYVVTANPGSNSLGVVRIDSATGLPTFVGSTQLGAGPIDVKITSDGKVIAVTPNHVQLLDLDPFGALLSRDVETLGGVRITSVDVLGREAVVGTNVGELHRFLIGNEELYKEGIYVTGSDITDVALSEKGRVYVTGGRRGVDAFQFDRGQIQKVGGLPMPGPTSRTVEIVSGVNRTQHVIINEFQANLTRIVKAADSQ